MNDSHSVPSWQSDGAGLLGRIGVLTPDCDPVPESEMWAMAPPGISIHASRVPYASLPPGDRARTFAETPRIDTAVELLAGLTPRVIVYAYTGTSYLLGAEADESLRARLMEVPPPEVFAWAKANVPGNAEAILIGGNGLRAVGVIHALEEALGRPVLTANQVAFWQALREMGLTSKVAHYGRVFTDMAAQQQSGAVRRGRAQLS